MTWDPKDMAPFVNGCLLHHPSDAGWVRGTFERAPIEWRDIDRVYEMTLVFEEQRRGRSAAYFLWLSAEMDPATGCCTRWPMFMTDLSDLICLGIEPGGIASGNWHVRKRGQNYGIARIS